MLVLVLFGSGHDKPINDNQKGKVIVISDFSTTTASWEDMA